MKSGTIFLLLGLLALWAALPPASSLGRPGSCPKPGIGVCAEMCGSDEECSQGQKCCFNGCGHNCMTAITQRRPGFCPRPTGVGACVERCRSDEECPRGHKCCSNGCGHDCTRVRRASTFRPSPQA